MLAKLIPAGTADRLALKALLISLDVPICKLSVPCRIAHGAGTKRNGPNWLVPLRQGAFFIGHLSRSAACAAPPLDKC